MNHREVRAIRGSLTQKEFAALVGVTPLTVLRWELAEGTKEARRPRPKMVERLRELAARGVGLQGGGGEDEDEDEGASERIPDPNAPAAATLAAPDAFQRDYERVLPLLKRLGGEGWARAEDELLGLLGSNTLETAGGRALASIGCAYVQLLGRLDGRATFATLAPILRSVDQGELPVPVAARAHVVAASLFAMLDSRFFDPGRINAHATQAEELLAEDDDDLRILVVRARVSALRFGDPEAGVRIVHAAAALLERARSPLAQFVASGLRGFADHVTGDTTAAARRLPIDLADAERVGLLGLMVVMLADRVRRMIRGAYPPDTILELTRVGREAATAGRVTMSEAYLVILGAEIEALCRAGRPKDASAVADEAMRVGRAAGVARYCVAIPVARTYLRADRMSELAALADDLESENAGTHGGLANVHAIAVRAMAMGLNECFEAAVELGQKVCAAPEGTIGLPYVIHEAHIELAYTMLFSGDVEGAVAVIDRCEALLKTYPSVSLSAAIMRLRGHALVRKGHFAEARQKFEASIATFAMGGDPLQEGWGRAFLDAAARAAAGDAVDRGAVERIGASVDRDVGQGQEVAPALVRRLVALSIPPESDWRAPTLTQRLAVAVDRLSVPGLRADILPRELASILTWVFVGREAIVGRDAPVMPGDETVDLGPDGGGLRIGVRGALDPDERAALRLLAAVTPLALRGGRGATERDVAVDSIAPSFIAVAEATRKLKAEVAQLARSSSTVLLLGESGTGKEVVARAVHDLSLRAAGPYVVFNCASVPRELFESQLFGHRRGSFTGATSDSLGVIRAADEGTLFLDEIGELPIDMQPKLLRFLENAEVLPVGEAKALRVNVRIIAATHRDLARHVREGLFREDLFYRLNVLPLRVPPLRERIDDVLALARFFIARLAPAESDPPELASDAIAALRSYTWPGNVRELRNLIERAMAYAPTPAVLHAEHLRIQG